MAYTESQKRATRKYMAKAYKRIAVDMRKEEYEAMKAYLEKTGESQNGFIRRLIREAINS